MERPILTIEERADAKTRHGIAGAADSDDGIVAASSADEALRAVSSADEALGGRRGEEAIDVAVCAPAVVRSA